jgi:ComF family protein
MLAHLDWVRSAYPFAGPLREAIHRFKYGKERARAAPLAAACAPLLEQLPAAIRQTQPLLCPVPLSAARRRERGYNQAEELARSLSAACGWSPSTALARIRATPPQVGLDPAARRANVRGAFAWQGTPLAGSPVLLIDDVLTTGATANECAAVLKAAGASWVGLLTVARAGDGR